MRGLVNKMLRLPSAVGLVLLMEIGAAVGCMASTINIKDLGAVGDGKTDDTMAFEKAIAKSAETGDQVLVPKGRYRITKGLTLTKQVLTGPAVGAWGADDVSMPTIITCVKDAPTFRLTKGAGIHGLNIQYDWQDKEPPPRPPVIEIAGVGCRVSEVVIRSPWDG
ncbi:MAG: glycoside hydrolase family 55 protein, partial [Armatimonadetes bacterium]|nr:glycoside hydrolase family 55 protein [Armatimonadota bacterium]